MEPMQESCAIKFPTDLPPKLFGYEFYKSMGSPKHVVAPMVDQSELPFRLLCKKYGADLCYTPMFHSRIFRDDENYRALQWTTCEEDDPVVVQFCANDPEVLLEACGKLFELHPKHNKNIRAIDLNLGCPQSIAKRGKYGSFLMEEPKLISSIVQACAKHLPVPITCKIRIFPDVQQTIKYAQMIAESGCALLTVHGRTREQRGHNQGLADWDQIKMVRESLKHIPVFSNGNIQVHADIQKCLDYTGCDGVMSAEALLWNPAIFHPTGVDRLVMAMDYLDYAEKHPVPNYMVRSHVFKISKEEVDLYPTLRHKMATDSRDVNEFKAIIKELISYRTLPAAASLKTVPTPTTYKKKLKPVFVLGEGAEYDASALFGDSSSTTTSTTSSESSTPSTESTTTTPTCETCEY